MAKYLLPGEQYPGQTLEIALSNIDKDYWRKRRNDINGGLRDPGSMSGVPDYNQVRTGQMGGWSAIPGARSQGGPDLGGSTNGASDPSSPYFRPRGEVLYSGSPYFDRGRNWELPARHEFWTDHGMTMNDGSSTTIPDWVREQYRGSLAPASYDRPASAAKQELQRQIADLQQLKNQNTAIRAGYSDVDAMRKYAGQNTSWQSRQYDQQHYPEALMPDQQAPTAPMQANSGAGWGAVPQPAGPTAFSPNDFSQNFNDMRQASGYRPGMGSMTPEAQAAADAQWDIDFRAREAALNQIPAHVPWGDPRIQNIMDTPVQGGIQGPAPMPTAADAASYNAYPSFGAQTGAGVPNQQPNYTQAQLADWDRYKEIMADQRPWAGLR